MWNDPAIIIELVTLLILIVSVLIASRQLYLLRKTNKESYEWNKRIEAQKVSAEYEYNLVSDRKLLNKELQYGKDNIRIPYSTFENKFNTNLDLQISCHNLLNYFESLCIGISNHVYDEEIIKDNFKVLMIQIYDQFKPYIDERSKNSNDSFCRFLKKYVNKWSDDGPQKERSEVVR